MTTEGYGHAEMLAATWMATVALIRSLDPETIQRFRIELSKDLEQRLDPLLEEETQTQLNADVSKVRELLRMYIEMP